MDIREIAKRAKVSTATVSRTINRVPTVDPRLAERVWKVVEESGYYPNIQARALVSGRSRIFGLVVSEITNPFFPEIVQAFEDMAVEHGYEVLLVSTVHDPKRMELSVRRMVERRVDGVAVMTFGMEDLLLENPKFDDVPLVFVDVGPKRPSVTNIRIDYQRGIREAVRHLANLRHEKLAFISGPLDLRSAVARRNAFEKAIEEIGLSADPKYIVEGDHTIEGGMKAVAKLLALRTPPTAVMCSNDMTGLGVLRKCYEEGVGVPRDLSVVGFDDIKLAQFVLPPLTTIRMSQSKLARLAFRALLGKVQNDGTANDSRSEFVLETNLIVRDSTAPPVSRTQRPGTKAATAR